MSPGSDDEVGDRLQAGPMGVDGGAQDDGVGAGNGSERAVDMADPRDDRAVVEADREVHAHRDAPGDALDDAHDVDAVLSDRHAVGHGDRAVVGDERGLEHEGVVEVAAVRRLDPAGRRELPASVLLVAEDRRERRARVEPRRAPPVDRTVGAHQRSGLGVADERVVLDAESHER